jgi:hypothetical protein
MMGSNFRSNAGIFFTAQKSDASWRRKNLQHQRCNYSAKKCRIDFINQRQVWRCKILQGWRFKSRS